MTRTGPDAYLELIDSTRVAVLPGIAADGYPQVTAVAGPSSQT
jgi:hypothetical protein